MNNRFPDDDQEHIRLLREKLVQSQQTFHRLTEVRRTLLETGVPDSILEASDNEIEALREEITGLEEDLNDMSEDEYSHSRDRNENWFDDVGIPVPIVQPKRKTVDISKMPSFTELQTKILKDLKQTDQPEIAKPTETSMYPTTDTIEERKKRKKPRPIQKKPKLAIHLNVFKKNLNVQAVFYRYIRPMQKVSGGIVQQWSVNPKGGACLLLTLGRPYIRFTFALCSDRDRFNKDVARKLCQDRYIAGLYNQIENYDMTASLFENIKRAGDNYFYNLNRSPEDPRFHIAGDKLKAQRQMRQLLKLIDYKLQNGEF